MQPVRFSGAAAAFAQPNPAPGALAAACRYIDAAVTLHFQPAPQWSPATQSPEPLRECPAREGEPDLEFRLPDLLNPPEIPPDAWTASTSSSQGGILSHRVCMSPKSHFVSFFGDLQVSEFPVRGLNDPEEHVAFLQAITEEFMLGQQDRTQLEQATIKALGGAYAVALWYATRNRPGPHVSLEMLFRMCRDIQRLRDGPPRDILAAADAMWPMASAMLRSSNAVESLAAGLHVMTGMSSHEDRRTRHSNPSASTI